MQKPEVGVHVSDTHLIILNINLYKVRQHFSLEFNCTMYVLILNFNNHMDFLILNREKHVLVCTDGCV